MMRYPEHGYGVVVCTNNDLLNPDVAIEIAHRALGGKIAEIWETRNTLGIMRQINPEIGGGHDGHYGVRMRQDAKRA
jgi:hypothetical protein